MHIKEVKKNKPSIANLEHVVEDGDALHARRRLQHPDAQVADLVAQHVQLLLHFGLLRQLGSGLAPSIDLAHGRHEHGAVAAGDGSAGNEKIVATLRDFQRSGTPVSTVANYDISR